ncbi:spore germination protein [Paenibacillus thermotolerans]|uniref:spore germination protein n=1 Tax=Paenibacillus thermotolerans TaxID=3027807 RepID=UPI002367BC17|nr:MULTISPECIES: spore germination protein [unclassified Paenibacillus]
MRKTEKVERKIPPDQMLQQYDGVKLSGSLDEVLTILNSLLGENADFVVRHFHALGTYPAAMVYISSLVDLHTVNTDILKLFMYLPPHLKDVTVESKDQLKRLLRNDVLYNSKCEMESQLTRTVEGVLRGKGVVFVDGLEEAFLIEAKDVAKRGIDQPATEQVIRGPREGFIEQLQTNIGLLRYRLPSSDFCVKTMEIGRLTKSNVIVCYIKGVANDALVEEVQKRLAAIDVDGVLDAGHLEQFIEDNHFSPFPQVQNTERPDKAVANLLEGRVIILVDGSPFALIVPTVFNQFYQVTEDYTERFVLVSFIRLARLVALIFSLVTPSLYVAVISFNPELIPTEFAVAVAGGRAGVPFPSVVEVFIMEVSMEVLREATVRLPQQVGGALSIVGVLVIGQAAVAAGFVSPITVVVIALTTIGSFATPAYNAALALRLLRFPLIFLAGMFGLYGVMVGLILIANHLLSIKSFGVPYLSPLVPGNFEAMKDTVVRPPLWWMKKRPAFLHTPNRTRLGQRPGAHIKRPVVNTLDPLKVGNERWNGSDGIPEANNDDTSGSRSD